MGKVAKPILLDETGRAIKEQLEQLKEKALIYVGPKGDKGDNGRGIIAIEKTLTEGLVDTYTITYSDNSTSTYIVTNGEKGDKGVDGTVEFENLTEEQRASLKGEKGDKGVDGTVEFESLTEEQRASLKGEKGDKGDSGMTEEEIKLYIENYISENYENANEGAY